MSVTTRIKTLNEKRAEIKAQIHEAYVHHQPVVELKKENLKLKDEIKDLLESDKKAA